jgi:hypothetical protein
MDARNQARTPQDETIQVPVRLTQQQLELLQKLMAEDPTEKSAGEVVRRVFVQWLHETGIV